MSKHRHPYLSRKFITTVGTLAVVFLLEYHHPGSASNLYPIVPALLIAHHGANAACDWIHKDDK